jgi:hypothetical protein
MKLYDIKEKYLSVLNSDIDEEYLIDTLESIEADFDEKADNVACYIKQLEYEAEAIKREIEVLKKRNEQKQKEADKLKEYLFNNLKELNKTKIETSRNNIQIKKNPSSVVLDDSFINWAIENKPELIKVKHEADKLQIKEILKKEIEIPFARLEQKEKIYIK